MLQRLLLFIFFLQAGSAGFAQSQVTGKIYLGKSDSVLAGINVLNKSKKTNALSATDGVYSITAAEGDTLIFSGAGFENYLLVTEYYMLLTPQDISLKIDIRSLKPVIVYSSYQRDSLDRRNQYRRIFEQTPNITGGNRPQNGFGISLSPLSYFSSKAKAQRKLKKRLIEQEQESYIDFSFPEALVANLTKLSGDSLRLFLYRYRPSYKFCRNTDRLGMILYINDRYKEFTKPEAGK